MAEKKPWQPDELRAWEPSLREQIGNSIYDVAMSLFSRGQADRMRNEALSVVDFVPGVGDAIGLNDAYRAADAGRYGEAATTLGLTAVGAIPGVGDAISAGAKKAGKSAGNYIGGLISGAEAVPALAHVPSASGGLIGRYAPVEQDYGLGNVMMSTGGVGSRGGVDIGSFSNLRDVLGEGDGVYVRWSRGPEFDLRPGANSRDYQTGEVHDGLSALALDINDSNYQIGRMLRDYSYLKGADDKIRAHIYKGRQTGIDSDNAPSIRPEAYLGTIGDEFSAALEGSDLERYALMQRINEQKALNAHYAANPSPWVMKDYLPEYEKQLEELGGPIDVPYFY